MLHMLCTLFWRVSATLDVHCAAIGRPQPIMSEEELAEKEAARTGIPLQKSTSRAHSRGLSKARSQRRSLSLSQSRRAAGDSPMQITRSRRASKTFQDSDLTVGEPEDIVVDRGMILPFQPLSISFSDVSYFVDMPAVRSPFMSRCSDGLSLIPFQYPDRQYLFSHCQLRHVSVTKLYFLSTHSTC